MKKQIYQSPRACTYPIIGKNVLTTSMKIGGDEKVSDSDDIGFAKEQDSQKGDGVWSDEW